MDLGFSSVVDLLIPKESNGNFIIFHNGHAEDANISLHYVEYFLNNGFTVAIMHMPLYAENSKPTLFLQEHGNLAFTKHHDFAFIKYSKYHALKFFLEPVVIVTNYAQHILHFKNKNISMVGFSGGGWTTTFSAALDVRISKSYSVAGTNQFYIPNEADSQHADWEQYCFDIYSIVSYPELYLLGSLEYPRRHFQILNYFDGCCFNKIDGRKYAFEINDRLQSFKNNGSYYFLSDKLHNFHSVSPWALDFIIKDILSEKGILSSSFYEFSETDKTNTLIVNNKPSTICQNIRRVQDLSKIKNALDLYYKKNGSYPTTDSWVSYISSLDAKPVINWIPKLVPNYIESLPRDPGNSPEVRKQYLYQSNGKDFKLISHEPSCADWLSVSYPEMADPIRNGWAIGFWTKGAKLL